MSDLDSTALDAFLQICEEFRDDYWESENGTYDRAVLDCAARLAADPAGPQAHLWTLGMVVMATYLARRSDDGVREPARTALCAADTALRSQACDHVSHPYEIHDHEDDEDLVDMLAALADPSEEWEDPLLRAEWCCPRNAAGFARIAQDIVAPGSAADVPPRLPVDARDTIAGLTSLLEGYPVGWDPEAEIAEQGWNLSLTEDPDERPGRIMAVRAVSWHAASGTVRSKSVLDDLVDGLEKALTHYAPGPCAHGPGGHPALPDSGPDAAGLGIQLSYAAGRALYARSSAARDAPLEALLCPAFMAATAQETLDLLRERREALFGRRDTSRLDAEFLRPDGRPAIGKIAERLGRTNWSQWYAEDLGLWAARRYTPAADARERGVLLLTVHETIRNAYPDLPPSFVADVLPVLRSVAAAPRPERCGHDDAHPGLEGTDFGRAGEAAWACPRFAGELADAGVRRLEDLAADNTADDLDLDLD
ncbi:hypothetical protein T261_3105 [Streptomyces lydicus]|nr:hypothetical protein T261_3105 [Streptomyces lydicus]